MADNGETSQVGSSHDLEPPRSETPRIAITTPTGEEEMPEHATEPDTAVHEDESEYFSGFDYDDEPLPMVRADEFDSTSVTTERPVSPVKEPFERPRTPGKARSVSPVEDEEQDDTSSVGSHFSSSSSEDEDSDDENKASEQEETLQSDQYDEWTRGRHPPVVRDDVIANTARTIHGKRRDRRKSANQALFDFQRKKQQKRRHSPLHLRSITRTGDSIVVVSPTHGTATITDARVVEEMDEKAAKGSLSTSPVERFLAASEYTQSTIEQALHNQGKGQNDHVDEENQEESAASVQGSSTLVGNNVVLSIISTSETERHTTLEPGDLEDEQQQETLPHSPFAAETGRLRKPSTATHAPRDLMRKKLDLIDDMLDGGHINNPPVRISDVLWQFILTQQFRADQDRESRAKDMERLRSYEDYTASLLEKIDRSNAESNAEKYNLLARLARSEQDRDNMRKEYMEEVSRLNKEIEDKENDISNLHNVSTIPQLDGASGFISYKEDDMPKVRASSSDASSEAVEVTVDQNLHDKYEARIRILTRQCKAAQKYAAELTSEQDTRRKENEELREELKSSNELAREQRGQQYWSVAISSTLAEPWPKEHCLAIAEVITEMVNRYYDEDQQDPAPLDREEVAKWLDYGYGIRQIMDEIKELGHLTQEDQQRSVLFSVLSSGLVQRNYDLLSAYLFADSPIEQGEFLARLAELKEQLDLIQTNMVVVSQVRAELEQANIEITGLESRLNAMFKQHASLQNDMLVGREVNKEQADTIESLKTAIGEFEGLQEDPDSLLDQLLTAREKVQDLEAEINRLDQERTGQGEHDQGAPDIIESAFALMAAKLRDTIEELNDCFEDTRPHKLRESAFNTLRAVYLSEDQQAMTRKVSGGIINLTYENEELHKTNKDLTKHNTKLTARLQNKKSELAEKDRELDDKDRELIKSESRASELQKRLSPSNPSMADSKSTITSSIFSSPDKTDTVSSSFGSPRTPENKPNSSKATGLGIYFSTPVKEVVQKDCTSCGWHQQQNWRLTDERDEFKDALDWERKRHANTINELNILKEGWSSFKKGTKDAGKKATDGTKKLFSRKGSSSRSRSGKRESQGPETASQGNDSDDPCKQYKDELKEVKKENEELLETIAELENTQKKLLENIAYLELKLKESSPPSKKLESHGTHTVSQEKSSPPSKKLESQGTQTISQGNDSIDPCRQYKDELKDVKKENENLLETIADLEHKLKKYTNSTDDPCKKYKDELNHIKKDIKKLLKKNSDLEQKLKRYEEGEADESEADESIISASDIEKLDDKSTLKQVALGLRQSLEKAKRNAKRSLEASEKLQQRMLEAEASVEKYRSNPPTTQNNNDDSENLRIYEQESANLQRQINDLKCVEKKHRDLEKQYEDALDEMDLLRAESKSLGNPRGIPSGDEHDICRSEIRNARDEVNAHLKRTEEAVAMNHKLNKERHTLQYQIEAAQAELNTLKQRLSEEEGAGSTAQDSAEGDQHLTCNAQIENAADEVEAEKRQRALAVEQNRQLQNQIHALETVVNAARAESKDFKKKLADATNRGPESLKKCHAEVKDLKKKLADATANPDDEIHKKCRNKWVHQEQLTNRAVDRNRELKKRISGLEQQIKDMERSASPMSPPSSISQSSETTPSPPKGMSSHLKNRNNSDIVPQTLEIPITNPSGPRTPQTAGLVSTSMLNASSRLASMPAPTSSLTPSRHPVAMPAPPHPRTEPLTAAGRQRSVTRSKRDPEREEGLAEERARLAAYRQAQFEYDVRRFDEFGLRIMERVDGLILTSRGRGREREETEKEEEEKEKKKAEKAEKKEENKGEGKTTEEKTVDNKEKQAEEPQPEAQNTVARYNYFGNRTN